MAVILIFLTIILLSTFLVLGVGSHYQKTGKKWFYFSLTVLSLLALVFLLYFF